MLSMSSPNNSAFSNPIGSQPNAVIYTNEDLKTDENLKTDTLEEKDFIFFKEDTGLKKLKKPKANVPILELAQQNAVQVQQKAWAQLPPFHQNMRFMSPMASASSHPLLFGHDERAQSSNSQMRGKHSRSTGREIHDVSRPNQVQFMVSNKQL